YRNRITQRDVVASVVALGIREDHVAAARYERIDDFVVLKPARTPHRRCSCEQAHTADDHRPRASHAATSFLSSAEPCFVSTRRPSASRAAGLPFSLSASATRRSVGSSLVTCRRAPSRDASAG